jgi:hypothetical protein
MTTRFIIASPSNAENWIVDSIDLIDDDTGEPVSTAGITFEMELRDPRGGLVMTASTADGRITTTATALAWDIPESAMSDIRAGTYLLFMRADDGAGTISELINQEIAIREGGFK